MTTVAMSGWYILPAQHTPHQFPARASESRCGLPYSPEARPATLSELRPRDRRCLRCDYLLIEACVTRTRGA